MSGKPSLCGRNADEPVFRTTGKDMYIYIYISRQLNQRPYMNALCQTQHAMLADAQR
jgi:hypothetical protein